MSTTTAIAEPNTPLHPNLVISTSKAYDLLFTKMRDVRTRPAEFAFHAKRAMRLLAEDAIAELPTVATPIVTPCGHFRGVTATANVCAVSIVRAGDALLESVRECLPGIKVGKVLIQRNEASKEKEPVLYYSKLPPGVDDAYVLLCDPMLATGGSAATAIKTLAEKYHIKTNRIIFLNMICCPEGIAAMANAYPEVKIVTACIDEGLNDDKFIVPGLGDFGDRFFNTV